MNRIRIYFVSALIISLFGSLISNTTSSAQISNVLPPLKIVQLGDSYSAGNGARDENGRRNYDGVSGCYRSPTNWGSQFAESLKDTFSVTYINSACSGGVVENITEARDMKDSVLKRLNGSCPTPDYPEEFFIKKNATQCSRFLHPQIDTIDEDVNLVIMTMGGNDLQFNNIVRQCFMIGDRHPTHCENAVKDAYGMLGESPDFDGDLKTKLLDAFGAIKIKLRSGAKVIYVAYPQILLDVDYKLLKEGPFSETYEAGDALRKLAIDAENMQRAVVAEANERAGEEYIIFYDGTKTLFDGHEPHPEADKRNPARWIHEFDISTYILTDSYHPNPLGHENWGRALSVFETFGVTTDASFGKDADVDIAFVVDTTGSMGDEIAQVRADLSKLVNKLASTTNSYRVAVVSYRDFPERTGNSVDYPYRVDQTFTNNLSEIQAAIDSLTADGGEDDPETVFSGIQAAIELPWRPGVTKTMIVIGDAPALSPEPISGLTAPQIVANSIAVDPVQVIGVNVDALDANGAFSIIANGTGGSVMAGTSELTDTILEIFDATAKQPLAWVGQAYAGKIGEPIQFDASGSYDPSGLPISLYEWDFDNDGVFDLETTASSATHTYNEAYNDYIVLRVTSPGGTALASARTVANEEGFVSQGDEESCELDENGHSIIIDENGIFIPCTADHLPTKDIEGVSVVSGGSSPAGNSYRPSNGAGGILPFIILFILGGAVLIYYIATRKNKNTSAYLQIINDPNNTRIIPLKDGFIIGRGSMSTLRLADTTASRQHARFSYANGVWFIQDLGSAGGTFVNGQRVQAQQLNNGDQIKIGQASFAFRTQ